MRIGPSQQFVIEFALSGFRQGRRLENLFPDQSKTFLQQEALLQTAAQDLPEPVSKLVSGAHFPGTGFGRSCCGNFFSESRMHGSHET